MLNRRLHACLAILALLAVLITGSTAAHADEDHWYTLLMQNERAGWMHVSVRETDTQITTQSAMEFKVARAGTTIAIAMRTEFVETTEGKPLSMSSEMKLGNQPTEATYVWGEDGSITVTTRQGDFVSEEDMDPIFEDWMTPAAAGRHVEKQMEAGKSVIAVTTMDASVGPQPITVTRKRVDPHVAVRIDGEPVDTSKWVVTQSYIPGVESIEYLDAEGNLVKGTTNYGPIEMTMMRTSQALAMQGGAAPEMMVQTFVKPDKRIRRPRQTTSMTMELSVTEGDMPALPTVGAQTAELLPNGRVRLSVTTERNHPADDGEATDPIYTDKSTYLDYTDPIVAEMAEKAKRFADRAGDDPADRAEAIRDYVYRTIDSKSLGVGFATASEVARTCEGDCSEHGVLLAALLRADGIPSRVVTGLIYADQFAGSRGIFGYHMWAQALIDGKWVDYDATLPQRYDATHITIATSSLADDQNMMTDLAALIPLMGRLEIDVIEVDYK